MSRRLAGRIDVKDNVAAPLPIKDAANALRCPAVGEGLLFEERPECFQTRAIDIGEASGSNESDAEEIGVQTEP